MTEVENLSVGERLLLLRDKHNMTQEDLAKKLVVSRQSVSKWELNKALPDMDKLIQLAKLYQVSIDYLVMGNEPAERQIKEDILLKQETVITQEQDIVEKEEGNQVQSGYQQHETEQNTIEGDDGIIGKGKDERRIRGQDILVRKYILLICILFSGILCFMTLIIAGKILSGYGNDVRDKEQEMVQVDRIYEQYTKAEVKGSTEDGRTFRKIVVLDVPGVKEDDTIQCYINSGNPLFEYYAKTVWMIIGFGIVIFLFFLVFLLEFIRLKPDRY
ncbi:MAG: helix-turn-helix domain-containing protein [Bacteroidales bacterium]|nr:helix-turn-helix domain-containing protein [Clostridium sp.]MCM1204247.1 helix-turn-helix domain-containing protein [Bacteroidales bacterium]